MKLLRTIVAVHAIGVFTQAVLAGQFLSGPDGAVYWHEVTGWIAVVLCLLQIAVSVSLRVPRDGTLPFSVSSSLIFLAELLQAGTGYGRFLEVHVPLGALILAGVVAQLVWVFLP